MSLQTQPIINEDSQTGGGEEDRGGCCELANTAYCKQDSLAGGEEDVTSKARDHTETHT